MYKPSRITSEMKTKLLSALLFAALLALPRPTDAAEEPSGATKDLKELITHIQKKLQAGDRTEEKLAGEMKEFDVLLAKYKGEKTDDVAQILFMKAQLKSWTTK